MKRKRINLFPKRSKLKDSIIAIDRIVWHGTLVTMIIGIAAGYLTYQAFAIEKKTENLKLQLTSLKQMISKEADFQEKLIMLNSRQAALKIFMGDDKDLLPYYQLLEPLIVDLPDLDPPEEDASSSAQVVQNAPVRMDSFVMDKHLKTNFILRLSNEDVLPILLEQVESEEFLNNFTEFKMEGFTVNRNKKKETSITLSFSGIFSEIKNKEKSKNPQ